MVISLPVTLGGNSLLERNAGRCAATEHLIFPIDTSAARGMEDERCESNESASGL